VKPLGQIGVGGVGVGRGNEESRGLGLHGRAA